MESLPRARIVASIALILLLECWDMEYPENSIKCAEVELHELIAVRSRGHVEGHVYQRGGTLL
jgi:hypothetical protein